MKTPATQKKRLNGFSLVEMAIVIVIAAILTSAGLSLLAVKRSAAQLEATQKNQEAIKQALINYLGKNHRLPCPATSASTQPGAEDRTGSPCSQYSGIVPYQELGLDRAVALDGWENFITYVVSPPAVAPPVPTPPLTTAWLYTYTSNSATATGDSSRYTNNPPTLTQPIAFWPSTSTSGSTGGIRVKDGNGNLVANPATATGAAVVLISYGKNGYGAYNVKGGTTNPNAAPPGTNLDEITNATPVTGPPTTVTVVKRDTTDSLSGNGPFDDIVMILSANDLTGPLIANGTLQANAQAAFSQANDIVMGKIVESKKCPDPVNSPCPPNSYSYTVPLPSTLPNFPASVTAWGMIYGGTLPITITATSPSSDTAAYTLTAGDGTSKNVLIGELRGILTRGAGF